MRALLLVIVAVALLFVAGSVAIDQTLQSSGERFDVEGEDWQPEPGSVTSLEQSNIDGVRYDRTVYVFDSNGVRMIDGNDYVWHHHNGTVEALDDGRLANESQATIDYGYGSPYEGQEQMASLFGELGTIVPALLLIGMAALILTAMARLARIG